MRKDRAVLFHITCCLGLCVLIWWSACEVLDGRPLDKSSDANHYMKMGYNFIKHQTYSPDNSPNPVPSTYREPGYPTYVGLAIGLDSELRSMGMDELLGGGRGLVGLRKAQIPLLLLAGFLTMYAVYSLTGSMGLGYVGFLLVGLSMSLMTSIYTLKLEHFLAPLLLIVSIFFYKLVQKQSWKYFVLCGLSLGVLVLTRAVFMYLNIFMVLFLAYLGFSKLIARRKLILGTLLFLACYFVIVGSWQIRNYIHFKSMRLAGRGGVVLSVRSQYNMMTAKEYFGSFLYWTPDSYIKGNLIKALYGKGAWQEGGALGRLNRSNYSDGYYRTGRAVRDRLIREYGAKGETSEVDKGVRKAAFGKILSHPFRHIFTTLPIGWRGLFAEKGYALRAPFVAAVMSSVLINLAYFGSLFFVAIRSIRLKQWDILSLLLPGLYLYGINSFMTHNIPRYSIPVIPLLSVMLLYTFWLLLEKRRGSSS